MLRCASVAVLASLGCTTPRALWIGGDVHLGNGDAARLREVATALRPAVGVVNLEGPIGAEAEAASLPDGGTLRLVNGPRAALWMFMELTFAWLVS